MEMVGLSFSASVRDFVELQTRTAKDMLLPVVRSIGLVKRVREFSLTFYFLKRFRITDLTSQMQVIAQPEKSPTIVCDTNRGSLRGFRPG